jgi:hypothetical protein
MQVSSVQGYARNAQANRASGALMLDSETTVNVPAAPDDPKRISVSMRDRGFELILFFEWTEGLPIGDGPLLEVRLLPDTEALTPGRLRDWMPRADLYTRYARSAIKWEREESFQLIAALRETAKGRTALDDRFYRTVADVHEKLVADGERHPVKAMAAMFDRSISASSRWIDEARRRGFLPPKGEVDG